MSDSPKARCDDLLISFTALTSYQTAPDLELLVELELSCAKAHIRRGEYEDARALLSRAVAHPLSDVLKQQAVEQLLTLAKNWAKQSDPQAAQEAERVLRFALEQAPAQAAAPLAHFLQQRGRLAEAVERWHEAIRRNPEDSSSYLSLARLYKQQKEAEKALASCLDLMSAVPSGKNTLVVAGLLDELAGELPRAKPNRALKVALLGNATLNHIQSYLKVELYRAGLRPDIRPGSFGQYAQEILDPQSDLYSFAPDVLILSIHPSQLFPKLHHFPLDISIEDRRAEMGAGLESMQRLLTTFTQQSPAMVLVHNMVIPQHLALSTLDLRDKLGQTQMFAEINMQLAEIARSSFKNVYIVDEDRIQSRSGKAQATDTRMWLTARLPWSDVVLRALAHEYMRYILPLKGLSRKCIVVDLDNTLWGGVVGEDGLAGIQLGSEAPGSAYVAFQRELERLWKRGILLAVSSKNNLSDVLPVFEQHPGMVLKLSHFTTHRINWKPKADNIREIAMELNIGLDSIVFLDDNPVERTRVQAELPEVLTPELPADPAFYRAALLGLEVFDTLALTEEDQNRNKLYAQQRVRRQYEATFSNGSLEEYLTELEMVVDISPANSLTMPRIAQLTNKTNQFNLTTRRYSEAEIAGMEAQGSLVYSMSVRDRFGDNGLVGVAIVVPKSSDSWEIDTFLLSCRVMGRGVETALLVAISEQLRAFGAEQLYGWFIPSGKNAPAESFYPQHSFEQAEAGPGGSVLYRFNINEGRFVAPAWLRKRVAVS
ncbi:MAG: HAD-IIIC family phosphatase [Chloroflexi bacterium]|nr:HAD-IIIC family phosphatase [Chloroflexota bacterium]